MSSTDTNPAPGRGLAGAAPPVNALVLSIDLDEWYHCRWATGSARALYREPVELFRAVYGTDTPPGQLAAPTRWLLETLAARRLKATFFILGEMSAWYPDLVRAIAAAGHEIACHGLHHCDMSNAGRIEFSHDVRQAKAMLEDLVQQPVLGFRAPNLVVEPFLADVLEDLGFRYDSSVCPSRGIRGKYADMLHCSQHPYRIGATIQETGTRQLWEIPIPTLPLLRLPACSGIATRVFGLWWSRFALWYWGRRGHVQYYFHPYELVADPLPVPLRPAARVLMRRRGAPMQRRVGVLLDRYGDRVVSAAELVARLNAESAECPSPADTTGRQVEGERPREPSPHRDLTRS